MNSYKPKAKKGPEFKIREDLIAFLKIRDWLVKIIHGNALQNGLPDLYCAHFRYGQRWIEVKNPFAYSFTAAQIQFFPLLDAHGVGIWILTAGTEEEYQKLFKKPNWFQYFMVKV